MTNDIAQENNGDCLSKLKTELPASYDRREVLAYRAGVIDSDGTIGVRRSSYSMRVIGDCGQATYSERICVKQVEPQAIDLLHSLFGGYRRIEKPSAKYGRSLHSWQVTNLKAAACLRALLPFLRIKRAQAENCLKLREIKEESKLARMARGRGHRGAAPRPAKITEAMELAYVHAKELNAVGVLRSAFHIKNTFPTTDECSQEEAA
jgi:hypothetical protein